MKKRMIIMLVALVILFGGIALYKAVIHIFIGRYFASMQNVAISVSTMKAEESTWQPTINSVGSTRAVTGVNVTTNGAGMVQTIYFKPGTDVKKGTVLVQLNADVQIGQLQALQATLALNQLTYKRDQQQFAIRAISQQTLDTDQQNVKNAAGQVASQAATVANLTITAPFSGRLGISNVNPGQYINPGDKVVTLQSLDPIYVDFYLPQQYLSDIKVGQTVIVTSDAVAGHTYNGNITTIDPLIDASTRNIEVEATIANPGLQLTPGMFVNVSVKKPISVQYITVPQTAISFNPYGDIAYIVTQDGVDKNGKPTFVANQSFVTTGDTRGEQVSVLSGLKPGDIIVTSGQLKLRNGSHITINNQVMPSNNPHPVVTNDHRNG